MSTTKHSRNGSRGVPSLLVIKRRRRLQNLLYTRKRVAPLAAEYRSHGLDDAVETYMLQLEVEQERRTRRRHGRPGSGRPLEARTRPPSRGGHPSRAITILCGRSSRSKSATPVPSRPDGSNRGSTSRVTSSTSFTSQAALSSSSREIPPVVITRRPSSFVNYKRAFR